MRLSTLISILFLSFVVAACGARSVGGLSDDGSLTAHDGSVLVDSGVPVDGQAGLVDSYGYVSFVHTQAAESQGGYESIALSAWFYGEQWDPFYAPGTHPDPLLVQTPDGVPCEIRLVSGMDGPIPVQPPPERDGGAVHAWSGFEGDGFLEIVFVGQAYTRDYRSPEGIEPWPPWITNTPLELRFESGGSAQATSFFTEMFAPQMSEILAPPASPGEPLTPDPDGTHRIAWSAVAADWMEINLHFNMDWDDAYFRCYPVSGQTELRLPHEWLEQYSWGSGVLNVVSVNEHVVHAGYTMATLRSIRVREQQLTISVWE
jgi:hypothetical protein